MTVNPTDKFLVNRDGSSYNVDQQDLMAQLEDDDLLLVNRNSKSYKITGAEFKDSLSSPPIIQSVTLVQDESNLPAFAAQISSAAAVTNTMFTDGLTFDGSIEGDNYATNAFDGDPNTQFSVTGAWAQVEKMALINVTQISGKFGGSDSKKQTTTAYNKNGDIVAQLVDHVGGQQTIPITAGVPIVDVDKIRVERDSRPGWFTIEINGEALTAADQNTELKFAVGEDISNYSVGDLVKEFGNGDDGRGTIREIDVANRTIELFELDNSWNAGSYMVPASGGGGGSNNRFTNRSYTTTTVMLDNGNPASNKSVRGWVEGTLTLTPETDVITNVASKNTGIPNASGLNVKDYSPTPSAVIGDAIQFTSQSKWYGSAADCRTGYVTMADVYEVGTGDFSFSCWVNPSSVNSGFSYPALFGGGNEDLSIVIGGIAGDGVISLNHVNVAQGPGSSANAVPYDTWTFINVVRSGGTISFYVNGSLDSTAASGSNYKGASKSIGAESGNPDPTQFEGIVQDIRFYSIDYVVPYDSLSKPMYDAATDDLGTGVQQTSLMLALPFSQASFDELLFASDKGLLSFENGDPVDQNNGACSGVISSVDVNALRMTIGGSTSLWGPANNGHFVIGPTKTIDAAKQYLNLDASLNVIGLNADDSYTRTPANTVTPKISFPATLDNGEAPDAVLPLGTSIQTEILAENTAGSDEMVSNVVTPSPSCISGPIETDTITAVDIPATPTSYSVRPHNVQSALLSGPTVPFNSADAFLETGIPLGTPPSVAISTHWLLFDLGVAATVTIGRESAGASASTAVLWGTNDPNASWTYVATGEYTDMREVSGSGYRFYAYGRIDADNIDGTTQTQTSASAVYFVTAASGGFPTLTFASGKDLAKLQPGDYIQQEDADYSSTELSELNPSDTVGGSITEEGLKFASNISGAWSRSYVGVDEDEKVQFEMTYLSGQGALIGFSLAGSDGSPGPGIIGAVYDSDGTIRFTNNYTGIPASSGYGGGKTVGTTIDNATGVVNFYLEGEFVGTCTLEPNQNLLLYVHANRGEVKANFGKDGFKYPVEGFANFERYEPSGTVASIDVAGNSLTMSKSYGTWGPANAGHYAIGPNYICPPITLDADDPDDVATFDAVKDALDGYKESRRKARLEVLRKLNESGFSDSEIVVAQCTPIETIRAADEIQERVEKRKPGRTKKTRNRKAD